MTLKTENKLLTCFEDVLDTREVRGRRYTLASLLKLIVLGLICKQVYFEEIVDFAKGHWDKLEKILGFRRGTIPHASTLQRNLAGVTVKQLQRCFEKWIKEVIAEKELIGSVDGKWAKQSRDEGGNPLSMLNVFEQNVKIALEEYPMNKNLSEPSVFKEFMTGLCKKYPGLKIFTLDAIYAQRDLCSMLRELGKDYVVSIKDNQKETKELIDRTFPKRRSILRRQKMLEKKRGILSKGFITKTSS